MQRKLGWPFLLLCLVIATRSPAQAGFWTVSYESTGTNTWANNLQNPPPTSWGPTQNVSFVSATGMTVTGQCQGTVTAVITWIPSSCTDTPPQKIKVLQYAGARWRVKWNPTSAPNQNGWQGSGTASNGLGSPELPTPTGSDKSGTSAGFKTVIKDVPPGGVVELDAVTIRATFSGSTTMSSVTGEAYCEYRASILDHDHPTNFRLFASDQLNPNHDPLNVGFAYCWDSTSGKVFHGNEDINTFDELVETALDEYVTFSGDGTNIIDALGEPGFKPFSPPFDGGSSSNPTITQGPNGKVGVQVDTHQTPGGFVQPYDRLGNGSPTSYTGTQWYRYHCNLCMGANQFEYLAGPFLIVRSVYKDGDVWKFKLTKHDNLPPSVKTLGPSMP
jgi:hypothetical protein